MARKGLSTATTRLAFAPELSARHLALFNRPRGSTLTEAMARVRSTKEWWIQALSKALNEGILLNVGRKWFLSPLGEATLAVGQAEARIRAEAAA